MGTRKLHTSDFDEFNSDRYKICQKSTKSLKEYYFTNEGSKIGISLDDPIKKDKKYIDDIINKVSNEGYSNEVLKQYIKHLIPVLLFLIISLLFLPGWLICCFCGCFKCCCCNCCKKDNYKIPFYITTVVLYALAICISIYGLIQSNSIFMGFADIECSILNFLNEIIEGETKSVNPKWIGLHNLGDKFNESKIQIDKIRTSLVTELKAKKDNVNIKNNAFKQEMEDKSKMVANNKEDLTELTHSTLKGIYTLDIVKLFGEFSKIREKYTKDSLMDWWYNEYKETAKLAEKYMEQSASIYDYFINDEKEKWILVEIDESLNDIEDSFFYQIKKSISYPLIQYYELIEKYGKLFFRILFSVIMAINAIIVVIISIKTFFNTENIPNPNSCLNCLMKSLIHIFWNASALMTFFALLFGSIFVLLGEIGKDFVSFANFILSDDNLNTNEGIIFDSASTIINSCINEDGNFVKPEENDNDIFNKIIQISMAYKKLEMAKNQANELLSQKLAYNKYKTIYQEIVEYKTNNFTLISEDKKQNFLDILNLINSINNYDTWSISCEDNSHSCENIRVGDNTDNYCIEPKTYIQMKVVNWYGMDNDYAQILDAFIHSISQISSETEIYSIAKALSSLDIKYTDFLKEVIQASDIYQNVSKPLADIFAYLIGDSEEIDSYINCRFIGKNIRVFLKVLDNFFKKGFFTVGICLSVLGLNMCLSISFTILINAIIDSFKKNNNNKINNNNDDTQELEGSKNSQNLKILASKSINQYNVNNRTVNT